MRERELKRFIIKGFVWTAAVVAVVEFVMIYTILNYLIPILLENAFPAVYDITTLQGIRDLPGTTKTFAILIILGLGIMSLLPLAAGGVIFSGRVTRKLKAYETAREAERAQEQRQRYLMISDIAHDLKTPMTTVSGYAKALSDTMDRELEANADLIRPAPAAHHSDIGGRPLQDPAQAFHVVAVFAGHNHKGRHGIIASLIQRLPERFADHQPFPV